MGNTGLWSNDLDAFAKKLQKGSVPFLALKWTGTDGLTYFSIIVNACGWTTFEIMGDSLTAVQDVTEYAIPRLDWSNTPEKHTGDEWTAVKVSRATANITAVKAYYKAVDAEVVLEKTYSDGIKLLEVVMKKDANIHLQFWQHPDSDVRATTKAWSVADFESYINGVHDDTMKSDVCGFSQWMDNHVAYNVDKRYDTRDLADIADVIKTAGHKVHWWTSKGSGYVVYSPDPTGWIVGYYGSSDNPPANAQLYGANCASAADGCLGQGYCKERTLPAVPLAVLRAALSWLWPAMSWSLRLLRAALMALCDEAKLCAYAFAFSDSRLDWISSACFAMWST